MAKTIRQRIERDIERIPESGCWIWTGAIFNEGYGAIGVGGKTRLVHRVAYAEYVGDIPDGAMVLHRCDVKPCCNPAHLYLGDCKQNVKDAVERGQRRYGDNHWRRRNPSRQRGEEAPNASLTAEQVAAIRERRAGGETLSKLAAEFSVSITQIWRIALGKSWTHT